MHRRGFLGSLIALVAAPFVAKAAPTVDPNTAFEWEPTFHTLDLTGPALFDVARDYFHDFGAEDFRPLLSTPMRYGNVYDRAYDRLTTRR